jgi:hypothetical protein
MFHNLNGTKNIIKYQYFVSTKTFKQFLAELSQEICIYLKMQILS